MTTEAPYPTGLHERVTNVESRATRLETRSDNHDVAIGALNTSVAVQQRDQAEIKEDMKEIKGRLGKLLWAAWALVASFITVVVAVAVKLAGG